MKYTPRHSKEHDSGSRRGLSEENQLIDSLEPVALGLGLVILELTLFKSKAKGKASQGRVQIRVTVYKDGNIGINDCSLFHKAILPRLELAFPQRDIYLEVLSPGIGRLIKDGSEFVHFIGRSIKCYTGLCDLSKSLDLNKSHSDSGWVSGTLLSSDKNGISLETVNGIAAISYTEIAKAKLNN